MTELVVPPIAAAIRLDRFLVDSGLFVNRSQAKAVIDSGRVRVDGEPKKAGFLLRGGEALSVGAPTALPTSRPEPQDIPLSFLYVDEEIAAIDKPAGVVVHPAPGTRSGTIVNALLHHGIVPPEGDRPGIVHRLDKETSGVLLVARTALSLERLGRAFHDREVRKRYLAIVLGAPKQPRGVIDLAIGRHPVARQKMSTRARRSRAARTEYELIESFPGAGLSLVELLPETGRTHQIRVHLAAMGTPVLADPVYGSKRGRAYPPGGAGRDLGRQALHAAALSFQHPTTSSPVEVHSPLPADLRSVLDRARQSR